MQLPWALFLAGFVVLAPGTLRADDDAKAARALVDRAIKAHGGAEKLALYKGSASHFKGTFHGMGMELPLDGEITTYGPDRMKIDFSLDAGGMKIRIVNVIAGNKGWTRVADNTTELDADALAEARETLHAAWLATLTPLVEAKGYTLATTGEQVVEDRPALGVRVSMKDRRDVTLFFDKASGMLLKYEHRVKDEATGQEVTEENFASGYKDVEGTKQAGKFTIKRDGNLYLVGEATDYRLLDKLDERDFAKPE